MTYQIPFFIVLAVCIYLFIACGSQYRVKNFWRKKFIEEVDKNSKFLMMNKNERAYFEATKKDIEVDPERQKEIDSAHEFQRKHDKIFLSGVIDDEDIEQYGANESTIS